MPMNSREVLKLLTKDGWYEVQTKGSHIQDIQEWILKTEMYGMILVAGATFPLVRSTVFSNKLA